MSKAKKRSRPGRKHETLFALRRPVLLAALGGRLGACGQRGLFSRARENRTFSGLVSDEGLAAKGAEARIGILVIDLRSCGRTHWPRSFPAQWGGNYYDCDCRDSAPSFLLTLTALAMA